MHVIKQKTIKQLVFRNIKSKTKIEYILLNIYCEGGIY